MLILLERSAWSAQTDFGFGLGLAHSDNINFAPSDPEETWVGVAAARLDHQEHSSDLEARVRGIAEYRDYQTDLYGNELLFSFDSAGIWVVDPGRVTWNAEDYFRQAPVDVFAAPNPDNRQNVNAFSTGPEATWRLSPRSSLIAGARYANFYFESSNADSHRLSAYGRSEYSLTARTDLSANAELSSSNFFNSAYNDYTSADTFLRLNHRWSRSGVEVDAGGTAIRRQRLKDVNGFLGRVDWHMDFNSYSGIELNYQEQYTDSGHDILERAARGSSVGYLNEQVTGDVFYSQHGEGAYHWQGLRTTLRVAGSTRTENYDSTPNDRQVETGSVGIGYELSPTLRAGVHGLYQHAEYLDTGQINKEKHGGLRLDYRVNTNMHATADLTRSERDSNVESADFEENRIMLTLWYQRGAPPEVGGPFGSDRGLLLQPQRPLLDGRRLAPPAPAPEVEE
jgi:hypothetical protein